MALMSCSSLLLQLFFKLRWQEQGRKETFMCKRHLPMPPGKKYKNAILAEIVREIENATLKASNSHGIEQCIIEQHKKDFSWLNKNNVDYFRRANLPANCIIIVKQPTVISDLLGTRNKVSKDMSSSINSNALLDTNTNPSQNDVSSLIMSSKDLDPSSSTKRASNPTKKHIQVD